MRVQGEQMVVASGGEMVVASGGEMIVASDGDMIGASDGDMIVSCGGEMLVSCGGGTEIKYPSDVSEGGIVYPGIMADREAKAEETRRVGMSMFGMIFVLKIDG